MCADDSAPETFYRVTVQFCWWRLYSALIANCWSSNGGQPQQKDHHTQNRSIGWPLDVLMCEIMLLWYNIHWAWLAIHMWPYLPNGSLIWVDRSTIGSPPSLVMHLTRNKAEINFPWSLCGALFEWPCVCAWGSTYSTSADLFVLSPMSISLPLKW